MHPHGPSLPAEEQDARRYWQGPALPGSILTAAMAEFCQSGTSVVLASCDGAPSPVIGRGVACRLAAEGPMRVVLRNSSNGELQKARPPHYRELEIFMQKLQSQGVHHITLNGAGRQTSIHFWEGVLGMPFVFEQPNLDKASESHLYFDPGDGRLITVFTDETRQADPRRTPTEPGCVHHIAFSVSRVTFMQAVKRLDQRGIKHSGVKDRGFMDSIYFTDPLGLLIELATYRFEPPHGFTHADVLSEAHSIRMARGDYNIAEVHLADAIEQLTAQRNKSLSADRTPKNPY